MSTLTLSVLNGSVARDGDMIAALPSQTSLDSAMATLVADGASPTQAHVTTANSAWSTYKTGLTTAQAAVTGVDAVVMFQSTLTKAQARTALQNRLAAIEGLVW